MTDDEKARVDEARSAADEAYDALLHAQIREAEEQRESVRARAWEGDVAKARAAWKRLDAARDATQEAQTKLQEAQLRLECAERTRRP